MAGVRVRAPNHAIMSLIRRLALSAAGFVLAGSAAQAATERPVLIELFTSQGCNSCPPADALLGELAQRPGVLALAFHVDYWNGLGWSDPFSSKLATARQNDYAQRLGKRSIYTPQLVVDGAQDAVGSDRAGVTALIDAARRRADHRNHDRRDRPARRPPERRHRRARHGLARRLRPRPCDPGRPRRERRPHPDRISGRPLPGPPGRLDRRRHAICPAGCRGRRRDPVRAARSARPDAGGTGCDGVGVRAEVTTKLPADAMSAAPFRRADLMTRDWLPCD